MANNTEQLVALYELLPPREQHKLEGFALALVVQRLPRPRREAFMQYMREQAELSQAETKK